MLVRAGGRYSVSLSVAGFVYVLAKVFVILFVAIGALDELADSLRELELSLALYLDRLVRYLDGFEHLSFLHFLHFTFDHHDVVEGSTYHQFDVGSLELLEGRIDDELTIDTCYTHFADRSVEGDI